METLTADLFVAKKIWGPNRKIVKSEKLRGGTANQGVFRHILDSGEVFIEKRTNRANEVAVSQMLLSNFFLNKSFPNTLPQIFDIIQHDKNYSIFMESLDELSTDDSDKIWSTAGMGIFVNNLHEDLCRLRSNFESISFDQSRYLVKMIDALPDRYKRETKKLKKIKNIFDREQKIFSHNDLFIPNMGTRRNKDGGLVAFDFGLAGINTPGSELHHFLDRSPEPFFNQLVEDYSSACGLDQGLVLAGAVLYSGFRKFEKSKNEDSFLERSKSFKKSINLAGEALML